MTLNLRYLHSFPTQRLSQRRNFSHQLDRRLNVDADAGGAGRIKAATPWSPFALLTTEEAGHSRYHGGAISSRLALKLRSSPLPSVVRVPQ